MSKYYNKRTDGYDSVREKARHRELQLMERAGLISGLERQVKFELIPAHYDKNGKCDERSCSYIADFTYWKNGQFIVEDCKGFRTDVYIIKRKLMRQKGYDILET